MSDWVEKNGHWFDLDYDRDLEEYLRECDVDPANLAGRLDLSDEAREKIGEDYVSHHDGLVGDDYYMFIEELENELRELNEEVLTPLCGDMRKKGCRKQDIINAVSCVISNLDRLIH